VIVLLCSQSSQSHAKEIPFLEGGEVGDQVLWGVPIFKGNKKKKRKNMMIYKDNNGLHIKIPIDGRQ
jgi:hypothetical protein